jgi:hypothetical protein
MTATPELLYLLAGDPAEFAQVVAGMRAADVAEALRDLLPPRPPVWSPRCHSAWPCRSWTIPSWSTWSTSSTASASAPFVATLVDVTGLIIYFTVALLILRGTLL